MAEIKNNAEKDSKNSKSNAVPLSDIFFLTLRHWPWILLSVAICVGIAVIYLLRTPEVYSRSAEILIKDESKGKSVGPEDFADFGLFQSNTNIENEVSNLEAKDLMEDVVKRLALDYNYYRKGSFHKDVVYGSDLPVTVSIPGFPEEEELSFKLSVSPAGKVEIYDLERPDHDKDSKRYTANLRDTIMTSVGKMVVSPTPVYSKGEATSLIVSKIALSKARDSYHKRLKVSMTKDKGTVIRLVITDQSKQRADAVLNTIIGIYNENWIHDKNQIAISTSNFINDRLGVIESELGNVDSDISSYKSANLVPDVQAAASMYMDQSQKTQAQILEVNNQLSMARYIRSYLTSDATHNQLLPANTGLQSNNIQALIIEYNDALLQRNALIAKSSEKNPLVAQLDQQLSSQRQAIVRTIDNEIVSLDTQLKSLRGSEAQTMSRIASNPTQAKNLLSTERQQKVKESLYLFLLQKREENELSQAFTAYNTRIVNKPGASGVPPTPNRRNVLAIAFLLGLAIPFGVTYLKETNNTKVRGRKDVENLAIPFLGEIPQEQSVPKADDKKPESHEIVVKQGNRDIINEAFRVLRTNVEFMCAGSDGSNVVAFTSFNPGSGKSFISMNLAMSLALRGKKVIVVDGDMRHGSTSAYVGSPSTGIADYLGGKVSDFQPYIITNRDCDKLSVLPVGSIPPNPTELLESPRFASLVEKLKSEYDYVIFDCPPIEVVADAQIIDRYAERTFFIVRAGLLERAMLPELDRLYNEKKYKNMAFILNGTPNEQGLYGTSHTYRYGYGYGYGYGYNYGDDKKKKK